jgi:4-hydroxybenzoate polyprenyltransferase
MHFQKLYGVWKLYDVPGWQKWFGAAVLGFAFKLNENYHFSTTQFQGLAIAVPLILCYNQSVNDYFDIEIDKIKEKTAGKKRIIDSIISKRPAALLTILSLTLGLVSAWFCSLSLVIICLVMAGLGTIYSAPPFRLKMKYPYSTMIQFVGCFLPFLAGVAALTAVDLRSVVVSTVFGFLAVVHRFRHEVHFQQVDRETGKMTFAVVKGMKTAGTLRFAFLIGGIMEFAVFSIIGLISILPLILFPLYVLLCVENSFWLTHLPKTLRSIFNVLVAVSGFVLLLIGVSLLRII